MFKPLTRIAPLLFLSLATSLVSACASAGTFHFRGEHIAVEGSFELNVVEHPVPLTPPTDRTDNAH